MYRKTSRGKNKIVNLHRVQRHSGILKEKFLKSGYSELTREGEV